MASITGIRVGTDFSDHAERAVGRAARLAPVLGLEQIQLVYALDPHRLRAVRELMPWLGEFQQKHTRAADEALHRLVEELKQKYRLEWRPELREGTPMTAMLEGAGASDLIVVGGGGEHGLGAVILGSTAERVVRASELPVLVVRKEPEADYRNVLVPLDFSPDSRAALELAREMAPDATFYLLHAYPQLPPYAPLTAEDVARYKKEAEHNAAEQIDKLVAECGLDESRIERILGYDNPPYMILEHGRSLNADLIAMGRRGQNRVASWLLGGVTTYVLNNTRSDVLVVPG